MTRIDYFLLNNIAALPRPYYLFDIWNRIFDIKHRTISFTVKKMNNETT